MTTPRRYRLLKDLPTAKAGEILTESKEYYYFDDVTRGGFKKSEVENLPYWYELIIEEQPSRGWQIIELKGDSAVTYRRAHDFDIAFDKLIELHIIPIHSVKRLSDNEVFSVGDDVEWQAKDSMYILHGIISELCVKENFMRVRGQLPKSFDFPFEEIKFHNQQNTSRLKDFLWTDELVKQMVTDLELYHQPSGKTPAQFVDEFKLKQSKLQLQELNKAFPGSWLVELEAEARKEFIRLSSEMGKLVVGDKEVIDRLNADPKNAEQQSKRIEVVDVGKYQQSETFDCMFSTNKPFPNEKFPVIKQAIENVLNDNDHDKQIFNAAKERHTDNPIGETIYWDGDKTLYYPERFKTFEDYEKSRK